MSMRQVVPRDHRSALRYRRQERVFSKALQLATSLFVFGGENADFLVRVLAAGAAAMGIHVFGADSPDRAERTGHWFWETLPTVVSAINRDVVYQYLDPEFPALGPLSSADLNAWLVVAANDPVAASEILTELATHYPTIPVLVPICGPGGIVVGRFPHARAARDALTPLVQYRSEVIDAGDPELAVLVAGLILNEIMLGPTRLRDSLSNARMIAFYDLGQPRRVVVPEGVTFAELARRVGRPSSTPQASMAGRRSIVVGAGAIGNWVGICAAAHGGAYLFIHDGDTIDASNLNRQVIYSGRAGEPKAVVMEQELRLADPQGVFQGYHTHVAVAADLAGLGNAEALVAVPDNEATRFLCADIARENRLLFGTAGSSPSGGQVAVSTPSGSCYRCLRGPQATSPQVSDGVQSCGLVEDDAVVCSNMVVAGLLVSELRVALLGVPHANVRFFGDSAAGNRLGRMITNVNCVH